MNSVLAARCRYQLLPVAWSSFLQDGDGYGVFAQRLAPTGACCTGVSCSELTEVECDAAGDLYVTVRVAAHPVFRREGDDLHMVVSIAVHEAALGAKIEIRTLDGSARLRVPPGTQSGQRFRLREHGAPSTRTGQRGDLIVDVRIVLPKLLDERSKELLREFGRINGENVREF